MTAAIGCYPDTMATKFTEAKDLSSLVSEECSRRNVDWQEVSKETIKMWDEAEPDYSFLANLKLAGRVSTFIWSTACIIIGYQYM